MFGPRVEAHAEVDSDRATGVLSILMGGTGICGQFSKKKKKDLW